MGKSLAESRTFWLNTVGAVIAAVTMLQQQPWVMEYPRLAGGLAIAYAVANVALRILTTEPIKLN